MKVDIFELQRMVWLIIAVMHTTWAVVKSEPEKHSDLNGIQTHDLCHTSAVLYQLSYQVIWELATLWVHNIPVEGITQVSQRSWVQILLRPKFFSGLNFTTAEVVRITVMISHIFIGVHKWKLYFQLSLGGMLSHKIF